jgi:uncharacterized protein YndB with AHSA1/START domain
MRKIILISLGVVLLIVVGVVGVIAMQPAEYRVTRSTVVDVPPDQLFRQVNDFRQWEEWTPWAALDPDAKVSFEGAESGEGAVFRWSGNAEIGEGSMTILESQPPERILIKFDMVRPFPDTSTTEFTFQPQGKGTAVSWSMYGENNFAEKAACLFMDLDSILGSQFEQGLARMKSAAEQSARPAD